MEKAGNHNVVNITLYSGSILCVMLRMWIQLNHRRDRKNPN